MSVTKPKIQVTVEIVIEPDGDAFHAYCPALKGLHTCGDTEEEALKNAQNAVQAYLRSLIKHGDPIPLGVPMANISKRSRSSKTQTHHHSIALAIPAA